MVDQTALERLWEMAPTFTEQTPHAKELGIKFISVDHGHAAMSLPYSTHIIGDPDTRVIHGGAVTTLLDQGSGLAAIAGFEALQVVATLNLSIDYMRAAIPGETIIAKAHCYKVTRHIAFVRGVAYEHDEDDPIATSQATFMVTRNIPVKDQDKDTDQPPKADGEEE